MDNLTNFITTSSSNPRGLAYVAYGDPERYAQVKNKIRNEIDLGANKLSSYSPDLIKDSIFSSLKQIFTEYLNGKYAFISDTDISAYSSIFYSNIVSGIDSISSYSDTIIDELIISFSKKFSFIQESDSSQIITNLISYLNSSKVAKEALGFISALKEESTNDLTKIDSLPKDSVIRIPPTLSEEDFKSQGQTIFSYENDYLSSVSNLSDLIPSSIKNLLGYPTNSVITPSDSNGDGSINLKDSSFNNSIEQSSLFNNSIANLNLVAALNYDPNKDPFNPNEGSIYNLTPNLNVDGQGLVDSRSASGSAFREKA